jgi:hypothetical protein
MMLPPTWGACVRDSYNICIRANAKDDELCEAVPNAVTFRRNVDVQ